MKSLFLFLVVMFAATAQYVVDRSSFGHGASLSPNKFSVPNWQISGEGHVPQVLSDKVILTPPYPGNRRGAIWAETKNSLSEWTAELDFRATGPERGGGNLQVWYTKDGQAGIGSSSIYTVGKFDGLVLVIDVYGGKGGGIRGFMNDGNTDFKSHHAVDSLAFGHCDYAYRNRGRPSSVEIKQSSGSFEVVVDHRQCFWSDKIKLPADYTFGISAASAETPDSFEVYKFLLSTTASTTREEPRHDEHSQHPSRHAYAPPKDVAASSISSHESQFADLHDRLQLMAHSLDLLSDEIFQLSEKAEGRHLEITRNVMSADKLNAMDQKLQNIEGTVQAYQQQFSTIQRLLKDSHSRLTVGLPEHMSELISTKSPRVGFLLFTFIAFQLLLAGSYIMYKRRKASGPKKYL